MTTSYKKAVAVFLLLIWNVQAAVAQKSIKEYIGKNDRENIMKSIVIGASPITAGGYQDGHGKTPLLTSVGQIPDTVALISLYVYDLGSSATQNAGNWVNTIYQSVSKEGGNMLANEIHTNTVSQLKAAFRKNNVVLLTPDEFLNTKEKRDFYYNTFKPEVSKIGNVLSNIENKQTDIAVCANKYRCFDLAAAQDHLRSQSLGGELAKKLGVDGVLSMAVELQSGNKSINMHGIKMSLHGRNPVPKEDKKYVGQNLGTGYYQGQIYSYGTFYFKEPIPVAKVEKKQLTNPDFQGIGDITSCFADKFHETMLASIEKAGKKYTK